MSKTNVASHESAALSVDNNDPDMPITQCKMGQKAPNFKVKYLM